MSEDKVYLESQFMKITKTQRLWARALLSIGWASKRALAGLLEYAGESEITPVLLEAGYQSLSPKAKRLAQRLVSSSSVMKDDTKERKQIQQICWFQTGQHVLREDVLVSLQQRMESGVI